MSDASVKTVKFGLSSSGWEGYFCIVRIFFTFVRRRIKKGWKLKVLYLIRAQLLLKEKRCERRLVKHVWTDIKHNKRQYRGHYASPLSCHFWFSCRSLAFELCLSLTLAKRSLILYTLWNTAFCSCSIFHHEGLW